MITACAGQLRLTTRSLPMGGAFTQAIGMDFNAVFSMGTALGVDQHLLASVLPGVERAIVIGLSGEGGDYFNEDG